MPATSLLKTQAGLLAQGSCQDDDRFIADEPNDPRQEQVHFLISAQNGRLVPALVFRPYRQFEQFRLHVTPVFVLHVRGTVQKESGKVRFDLSIYGSKHIELQFVEEERSLPSTSCVRLLGDQLARSGNDA